MKKAILLLLAVALLAGIASADSGYWSGTSEKKTYEDNWESDKYYDKYSDKCQDEYQDEYQGASELARVDPDLPLVGQECFPETSLR